MGQIGRKHSLQRSLCVIEGLSDKMIKYTEDQLYEIKDAAVIPQPQVLETFNQMIEHVKEHAALEAEKFKNSKWNNGDSYIDEHGNERFYHHSSRRRSSRTGTKPQLRKKPAETVKVDDDGWATLTKAKKLHGAEEGEERLKKDFKDGTIKIKPNNKNLGSSKAVDPREVIVDKQTNTFNAFEALGDEDDDEDEDEE